MKGHAGPGAGPRPVEGNGGVIASDISGRLDHGLRVEHREVEHHDAVAAPPVGEGGGMDTGGIIGRVAHGDRSALADGGIEGVIGVRIYGQVGDDGAVAAVEGVEDVEANARIALGCRLRRNKFRPGRSVQRWRLPSRRVDLRFWGLQAVCRLTDPPVEAVTP